MSKVLEAKGWIQCCLVVLPSGVQNRVNSKERKREKEEALESQLRTGKIHK